MKRTLQKPSTLSHAVGMLLLVSTALIPAATAAPLSLATSPLTNSTTTSVLPNVMYVLDNSGSMGWDFMPDYVTSTYKCKASSGAFSKSCVVGDPPYMQAEFNRLAYNPAIRYVPGTKADGTAYPSMDSSYTTGWTLVPIDGYGIQNGDQLGYYPASKKVSLVPDAPFTNGSGKGYPDQVWCNITSPTITDLQDTAICKQNSQYIYPSSTFSNAYTLRVHPYYYSATAGEYCSDAKLTTCVNATAPTGSYTYPAIIRWCNSSGLTNCQAKYVDGSYTYAKFSGVTNGTSALGQIKINAEAASCGGTGQPSCAAPSAVYITDITVDGVRIIPTPIPSNLNITDTTVSNNRKTLATNIASAINAYVPGSGDDFTAATGGTDTVTISRVGSGAFSGTIAVSATTVNRPAITGANATGKITITRAGKTSSTTTNDNTRCKSPYTTCSTTITISTIKVNSSPATNNILGGSVVYTTAANAPDSSANRNALATLVRDNINAATSTPQDYTATCGGLSTGPCATNVIDITSVNQTSAANGSFSITQSSSPTGNVTSTSNSLANGVLGIPSKDYTLADPTTLTITQFSGGTPVLNTFTRTNIEPGTSSYPRATSRTDCTTSAGACTYAEEMTNFANWYSYYRTRMQMMKTATSNAFQSIDSKYRVGFVTINNASSNYVPVNKYDATQKASWYTMLMNTSTTSSTPLREALSTVGRIFAGKKPIGTSDPVQYSCQQNFSLLTTDGYWNGNEGKQVDGTTAMINMDGGTTARPMYEGATASSDSLADVAKYYYDTDLRDPALGNCTGATSVDFPAGNTDVCTNNVFVSGDDNNVKQHMTTFTLGLGVDGTLTYTSDYKKADSGDFYDLKNGLNSVNWPVAAANTQKAVDDLWHAAVNGQGTYFSAKNPTTLSTSLSAALSQINSKVGAGAAAATSTLNPVENDDLAFVASYTTVKWAGNLEARPIDVSTYDAGGNLTHQGTGVVSESAKWCVEDVVNASCVAPSSIVASPSGSGTRYFCSTPGATCAAPDPGDPDGPGQHGTSCYVEVQAACKGTMSAKVGKASDGRTIYMNNGGVLDSFTYANLSATQQTNFKSAFLASNLSQWSSLDPATQQINAKEDNLVNFLRGQTGFEDRASNGVNTLFRYREATMGDALDSTPVFYGKSIFSFTEDKDPGFNSFKTTTETRGKNLYIGTNDGMLHAFDATNGSERWAYVPSMVIPNMWKLADKNYASMHTNFVNGDVTVSDICVAADCKSATASDWRTILVGALNGGGKGYYALDVTVPDSPKLLWEFGNANDCPSCTSKDSANDLGYSFGNPAITKKADGTWVVLVTSGYNNTTGSNAGRGFLYVLNAKTGVIISKIATGAGSAGTPSGLAKISGWVDQRKIDNTVGYIYGGDLLGNVWRFDINATTPSAMLFAELLDPSGNTQPITVAPELGEIGGNRVVFVGTGQYLQVGDLADTQQQSLYAIEDEESTSTLNNPRGTLAKTTVSPSGANRIATLSSTDDPFAGSARGWYVDFPDTGERQHVVGRLVGGTLIVPTTVPSNAVCSPGGYGWLNYFNYKTGGASTDSGIVSTKTNAPIVGVNLIYIDGKPIVSVVTSDHPTPDQLGTNDSENIFPNGSVAGSGGFEGKRAVWRELTEEE